MAVAIAVSPAHALDAKGFARMCENDISEATAYVSGVWDKRRDDMLVVGGIVANAMPDKRDYEFVRTIVGGNFCLPADANLAMVLVQACKWVKANPDKGNNTGNSALFSAWEERWPCPGQK
ncbi:Rap1a/Tai family immunity protein [Ancylobacter sp. VNQ12]|uniref:Rap1a/Tai family immunity protein n=1 Tax=Ancylobacter sp. VNQ12 TaxID=3400920 RepID=UPI003BFF7294